MDKIPFISIITASFNSEKTIRKTIESVKNQTLKNVEHIIVDNCSTDSTLDIIKEYEKSYNVRWVSEPDKGIADALNKGLKIVSGKYILIIQADDVLIDKNILQEIYGDLKSEQYDIVSYPVFKHDRKNIKRLCPNKPLWLTHIKATIRHQGAFVHERLHRKIGLYDTSYPVGMDYDFFYRAYKSNAGILTKDMPLAEMGNSGVSSDTRFVLKYLNERRKIQKAHERNLFWIFVQLIYYYYVKYLRHIIRSSYENPNKTG